MTAELARTIRGMLADTPDLLAVIGFLPGDQSDDLDVAWSGTVVDLDDTDLGAPLGDAGSDVIALIARTSTDLRRATSLCGLFPSGKHLVIGVVQSPPHRPFALPVISPGLRPLHQLQVRRGPAESWSVRARFKRPIPMGDFVTAISRGLDGAHLQATPYPRIALAGPGAARWHPGDPGTTPTTEDGPLGEPDAVLPADMVLRSVGSRPLQWADPRIPAVDRPHPDQTSWVRLGSTGGAARARSITAMLSEVDAVPPVDELSVNPTGFLSVPELGIGVLTQTGDCWTVQADQMSPVRFHPSGTVTDADVARLRRLRAVNVEWGRHTGPIAAVSVIAGLAAAGVPLYASHIPVWARACGGELGDLITGLGADGLADNLHREEHSIRLRRAALRTHSTRARWRNLAVAAGFQVPDEPRVSVILCTRRPDYLRCALGQVARQRHVDLELILTLHGVPADVDEVRQAVSGFNRPITIVEVPADASFGAALNRGVSHASGRYIAKWDDDDWYGPEHLADMMLAFSYSGADLVGCLSQLVYLEEIGTTVLRPGGESERRSRYISGGTLVMPRHIFDAVGGFRPMPRNVDTGLLRAIEAAGGRFYRTHGLGYMLHRRASGHTWTQPVTHFLRQSKRQWRGFRPSALIEVDEIRKTCP